MMMVIGYNVHMRIHIVVHGRVITPMGQSILPQYFIINHITFVVNFILQNFFHNIFECHNAFGFVEWIALDIQQYIYIYIHISLVIDGYYILKSHAYDIQQPIYIQGCVNTYRAFIIHVMDNRQVRAPHFESLQNISKIWIWPDAMNTTAIYVKKIEQ